MSVLKAIVFYVVQLSWGIVQNLVGLIVFIKYHKEKHANFFGAVVTFVDRKNTSWGGISLGIFIFVNAKNDPEKLKQTCVHEYGHTIQSLIFGPLYLLAVGLPSVVWCNLKRYKTLRIDKKVSYFSRYPENWANKLGEKHTGFSAPS